MNKVDEIRMQLAREVLCCFTCYYSIPEKSYLVCTLNECKPRKVADSNVCMNWYPDILAEGQADWENLLEVLNERRKGEQQ